MDAVRIPLLDRHGQVRAYTLIDAADEVFVRQWTWRLLSAGRGYAARFVWGDGKGRTVLLHRELLGLGPGRVPTVDHHSGDTLDNQRANLRTGTHALNQQNRAGGYGSSSFRGVHWDRRRGCWVAAAKLNGTSHYLGSYQREDDAARAAAAWRREHMPFAVEVAS